MGSRDDDFAVGEQYTVGERLGRGGMGEVHRAWDGVLERDVALKSVRHDLVPSRVHREQFFDEARITAGLQHPGIVPIHELGEFPDGRLYYTMKEVSGRTLADVAASIHSASSGGWRSDDQGWSLRRMLDAFLRVCEAMAYAHEKGVIHRDLKPDNVMVGEFGEVRVLDWGVAIQVGEAHDRMSSEGPVGTPGFIAPEQVRGETLSRAADVYSLGSVLYEILTSNPVFPGNQMERMQAAWLNQTPEWPSGPGLIPQELAAVCMRALAPVAADRYADAGVMAHEVRACLEGVRRRERARQIAASAKELLADAVALRESATLRLQRGEQALEAIPGDAGSEAKTEAWSEIDAAERESREADLAELAYVQRLQTAMYQDPDLPEARDALASYYRAGMEAAEQERDARRAAECEALLRTFDRGDHAAWLEGNGSLSLVTDPPGASVFLEKYEVRGRRMVAVEVRSLGSTPLLNIALPRGSYRCRVSADGRADVFYPVQVGRQAHWGGVPPGESSSEAVYLPLNSQVGEGECYVPAGWFEAGGDKEAADSLPQRQLWCPGFVIQQFPVTNTDFIAFLNDMVDSGDEDQALRHAPRERSGAEGEAGALVYGRDDGGHFVLRADVDGDHWEADWPVLLVDWYGAQAYASWLADKAGLPWRLASELEWEKAARGVDGRYYPWGDWLDCSWSCMRDSHAGRRVPASIHAYPDDVSPYGVCGLGGNARDWCADAYRDNGPECPGDRVAIPVDDDADRRVERGGCFYDFPRDARSANRFGPVATARFHNVTVRLVRSILL